MGDNKVKRGFLDADIIIKMGKASFKLLRNLVDLFDKCYLHQRIYIEVKFPPECKEILEELIREEKIILIEDKYLLKELESKGLFLLTFQQACNFFNKDYYQKQYSNLYQISSNQEFLNKIEEIGDKLDDIGEIRTLQMIIALFSEDNTDNYFISNDRRARNGIILNYNQVNIQGISLMSSFHYLKDKISKDEALDYVSKFDITKVRVYKSDGSRASVSTEEFIDIIYSGEYLLQRIGYIRLSEDD